MYQIVYVSSATVHFAKPDMYALLAKSRANNARAGVTGMLLYRDGNFMQVLEGDEEAVRTVYARIEQDPRHRGSMVLLRGETPGRQFPDWSMGFRDLSSPEAREAAAGGFNDLLNTPLTGAEFASDPTRAQRLLLSFKANMR